jgi:hypothetical protein
MWNVALQDHEVEIGLAVPYQINREAIRHPPGRARKQAFTSDNPLLA